MRERKDHTICQWKEIEPLKPSKDSKLGLAINSLNSGVLHGLRHPPENGTNGWYIWSGEYQNEIEFFHPVCLQHLDKYLPLTILEYLDLPPGYRFLIDGVHYEDVWYDSKLLLI